MHVQLRQTHSVPIRRRTDFVAGADGLLVPFVARDAAARAGAQGRRAADVVHVPVREHEAGYIRFGATGGRNLIRDPLTALPRSARVDQNESFRFDRVTQCVRAAGLAVSRRLINAVAAGVLLMFLN